MMGDLFKIRRVVFVVGAGGFWVDGRLKTEFYSKTRCPTHYTYGLCHVERSEERSDEWSRDISIWKPGSQNSEVSLIVLAG